MSQILASIKDRLNTLGPKEKILARYILEHPRRVVQMGIIELSAQTRVSTATISRFCRGMHFAGFSDFRMKLSADLAGSGPADTYQDIVKGRPLEKIAQDIAANSIRSIADTSRLLDFRQLSRAVDALLSADRIVLFGMATSGVIAQDFMQKLVRIGRSASAFTDSHMQITAAAGLTQRDAAIAISYSGETPETIDAASCAKEQGCTVISLTRHGSSALSRTADIPLFVSPLEESVRRGEMASRIALLLMVDILFAGMLSEQFDQYVPRLEQSYQLVNTYRKNIT